MAKPNKQKAAKWVPPRGIRLFDIPQCVLRPKAVQWRVDGARVTKSFPTPEAQETFAKSLVSDVKAIGVAAYRLNQGEAVAWRSFRAQLGETATLDDVLACWQRHGAPKTALTVREAVVQFMAAKKAEGLSQASLDHYQPIYDRMAAVLGARSVGEVKREDLAEWLDGLKMSDWSRRTHVKRAQGFFAWLKTNRLISDNPCDGLAANKIVQDEVSVLSVADGRSLFAKNEGEPRELCGRLALEALAGLRFSSAAQIVSADLAFDVCGITLPAAKIKTRRRQFIDGLPDNLWKWLKWSKPEAWKMTQRQYLFAKSLAFVRAGIKHPHNVLRHSFASYHVAANKDVSKTAVILCHSSPKMLWSHYKGRATEADGKAWFQILPK